MMDGYFRNCVKEKNVLYADKHNTIIPLDLVVTFPHYNELSPSSGVLVVNNNETCTNVAEVVQITFIIDGLIDFLPDVKTKSGRLSLRKIASVVTNDAAATWTLRAENSFSSRTTPVSVKHNLNTRSEIVSELQFHDKIC